MTMEQLTRWIPERWREPLGHLRDELQNIVERWFPTPHNGGREQRGNIPVRYQELVPEDPFWSPSRHFFSSPTIDIDETDDDVVVTADLPGLEPHDFAVEIVGERLLIRGEKKHQSNRTGHGYTYSERSYGAFARALQFPCEVAPDKARATYKQGVLRITLPKSEHAKATRVKIHVQ
jgi:HSP20 family protein